VRCRPIAVGARVVVGGLEVQTPLVHVPPNVRPPLVDGVEGCPCPPFWVYGCPCPPFVVGG
jgi:hypothetical protein